MARRTKRKGSPPRSRMKPFIFVLTCFLIGAGIYWGKEHWGASIPVEFISAAPPDGYTGEQLRGMTQEELIQEVLRLQKRIDARDKEMADLLIQLRLAEGGSMTGP